MKSYLVIGLGNPGLKYRKTRHNMGFMVIDYISEKLGLRVRKSRGSSIVGETVFEGHRLVLAKPQTYMNRSGEAVRELIGYYGFDIDSLVVVYDDMDIDLGSIRIRKKGSSGSHNGMKSIIYHLKDENFVRIRVGIGQDRSRDAVDYVLGKFTREQREQAFDGIGKSAESILEIVQNGIDTAMNKYNG